MSRSASLSLNLILSLLDANNIEIEDQFEVVDMAQAIENDYIGSPCGKLDQIMILFARADKGTYYNPADQTIEYVPLGKGADDFRIMVMDTGTVRPGLEKSTYKIRRRECQQLVGLLRDNGYDTACLADIKDCSLYEKIMNQFSTQNPDLCSRLSYIYNAQKRFDTMLDAWRKGDIETVGQVFRQDGIELRDLYQISGPQLETMCDIVRSIPGVLGERMLGGGDKGASGALLKAQACDAVAKAVQTGYPRSHPEYREKYAVHTCRVVDGVKIFDGIL
jgi:galactokinase